MLVTRRVAISHQNKKVRKITEVSKWHLLNALSKIHLVMTTENILKVFSYSRT